MSIAQITNFVLVIQSLQNIMIVLSAFQLPTKFKQDWEKCWLHIPNGLFYVIMTVSGLFELFIVWNSLKNLTPVLVVINLVTAGVCNYIWTLQSEKRKD